MTTPDSSSSARLATLGERGLIQRIRDRFPAVPGSLEIGIGDDAAVTAGVRGELEVLTTDALVEGVHFDLRYSSYEDVGYKALAVNVSDIAAMGATSRLALLSLILPDRLSVADVDALLDGFGRMAVEAGVSLAGGNVTRTSGPLVIDVTAVGHVRPRRVLTRRGGRPGDILYLTGSIGGAAAGLGMLRAGHPGISGDPDLAALIERHRRPVPRLRIGALLGRTRCATACMDVSDGLADAVAQLAGASGTGALIDAEALPIPDAARRWFQSQSCDPVLAAVAGGDDYELLFSVPPRFKGRLRTVVRQGRGVPVTPIGELTGSPAILLRRDAATEPFPDGFTHF